MPDECSDAKGPPDAQKEAQNLCSIKHWRYHIKLISIDQVHPTDHSMAYARQIFRCKWPARCPPNVGPYDHHLRIDQEVPLQTNFECSSKCHIEQRSLCQTNVWLPRAHQTPQIRGTKFALDQTLGLPHENNVIYEQVHPAEHRMADA